jgi:PAS domain S-box-containing protein
MPHRILLVEDEAILALAEARTIQKYGYEVVTAYTGREAIDLVESDPDISLILMDINLGRGMDGTETAQRILETHDLPIVFLSSHTEPAIVEKTEGITSYGYIVKNSGETVLIASIKMAFRLYEAHMAIKAQKENLRTALVQQEQAEEELLVKTEELDRYFTSSLDMLCSADTNGTLIRLNPEWETVLGYPVSELEGRSFMDLVHPDDTEATLKAVERLRQQEEVISFENRYRCRDGSYRWIEWRSRSMGNTIYAAARDITDRRKMEDDLRSNEKRYRNLFNNSAIALWEEDITAVQSEIASLKRKGVSDFDTFFTENPDVMKDLISRIEIIDVNDAAVSMHKAKSKQDLLGQLDKTLYPTDITLYLMKKELTAIAQRAPYVEGEIQAKNLEGQLLDLMVRINLLYQDDQNATILVAISDITMLKNALKEKNELMQELNHRVKNNLAMVSSLIRLKDSELGDTADLSDINHQIEAIRLIHEKLYQKEEIARISVREYIEDLIQSVFNSFTVRVIELESRIEDISLNSKTALSLGLIINEMATNAIKHGFNEKEDPRFTVEMKKDTGSNCYVLTVSNTGNPFPGEIDPENPDTLGLQIISTLVQQLDGTLELKKRPHPVFTITFPIDED